MYKNIMLMYTFYKLNFQSSDLRFWNVCARGINAFLWRMILFNNDPSTSNLVHPLQYKTSPSESNLSKEYNFIVQRSHVIESV